MSRALVVVTRFGWDWAGKVPSAEWVAGREHLLTQVTAPSLMKVRVPFDWVWLVAPARLEQVREIASRVYSPVILVAEGKDSEAIAPEAETFMVVRLDSDDALLPDALENVSKIERGWKPNVQGGVLAITSEGRENLSTMLLTGGTHGEARRGRTVVSIQTRSWLRVNHSLNMSTKHWPDLLVLLGQERDEILRLFGIEWRQEVLNV